MTLDDLDLGMPGEIVVRWQRSTAGANAVAAGCRFSSGQLSASRSSGLRDTSGLCPHARRRCAAACAVLPHHLLTWCLRRALKRAGVTSDWVKGAHLLRHSLATDLLRRGASLDEIGQLLRHSQPMTTQIYAKVDITALRSIGLAWPGAAS